MSPTSLYIAQFEDFFSMFREYHELLGLLCETIAYEYVFECEQQVKMKIPGADECQFKGAYSTGLFYSHIPGYMVFVFKQ